MSCNCNDQCSTPITIPTVNSGNDGADGSNGIFGGFSSNWEFSSSTSTGPTIKQIRLNNSTPASVTEIYVADSNGDSINMSAFLTSFSNGSAFGKIRLYKEDDKTKFWLGTLTAVTDNGTDFTLAVTHIQSNSTFASTDSVILSFAPAGANGSNGSTGGNGIDGANGVTVLHNDFATYSPAGSPATFREATSYVLPVGTLRTDGSMLKIKLLLRLPTTSFKVTHAVQLEFDGALGHTVGGPPSQIPMLDANGTDSELLGMLEYTFNRVNNTEATVDYKMLITKGFFNAQFLPMSFEDLAHTFNFDGASTDIKIYVSGEVQVETFTIEHYIK